jgi:hypothetical protein
MQHPFLFPIWRRRSTGVVSLAFKTNETRSTLRLLYQRFDLTGGHNSSPANFEAS